MGRIFALLSVATAILIITVGLVVYGLSIISVYNVKEKAAAEISQSVAQSLSGQIRLLNSSLDSIAKDPDVVMAVRSNNLALLETTANNIRKSFPQALKIRFLLPGDNKIDETVSPHMGFADLEMVKDTFVRPQLPAIQGDVGANRHLAMTSQVLYDGQVLAVVLASLDHAFVEKSIKSIKSKGDYVEIRQDKLKLGAVGEPIADNDSIDVNIPGTRWKLLYQFSTKTDFGQLMMLFTWITVGVILSGLAMFFGYRYLSKVIRNDLDSVLKAFKDIVTRKPPGSYPVNLPEMNVVILSFLRLRHVLDEQSGDNFTKEMREQEELEIKGFFSASDDYDFPSPPQFVDDEEEDTADHEIDFNKETTNSTTNLAAGKVKTDEQRSSMLAKQSLPVIDAAPVYQPPVTPTQASGLAGVFKTYDIRGIVGKELTLNMVYDIGRAFGTKVRQLGYDSVVIGYDGRDSGLALADELAKGLASTGCNILNIGMVPTPVLYFAVHYLEGHNGIMITGSDNPPECNGFKLLLENEPLSGDRMLELQQVIATRQYMTGDDMGLIEKNNKLVQEYIGTIAEDIRISRPILVVVDAGNGVGGKVGSDLLRTLGCEAIELHCEVDGSAPSHQPDPSRPENMAELAAAVKHYRADLGLAFDSDADRLGVVDSNGKIIWPDRLLMMFAKHVLAQHIGSEILYDSKCTKHLPEQIKKYGGRAAFCKASYASIKAKFKETNAKLAGELSGHFYFNDRWFGFDDALYTAARLIEILSNDNNSTAKVFESFPDSLNTPEIIINMPEGANTKLVEAMKQQASFKDSTINDVDGLRVEFTDGWGVVCASNSTPALTLRFEANDQEAMERIQQKFKQAIAQVDSTLNLPF